ncbi:MAG TPA: type II toxin-antitoxin system VapC family toxin [Stellaceae bacterium]|nr:type II toxin-antitoxin system VapC family toxin [Stellaceae bacterium]
MISVVLDASALLAMLLREPGGESVKALLVRSCMTTVNIAEVAGYYAKQGVAEGDLRIVLDPLPIERVDFDEGLAFAAGMLIPMTRRAGLSLGDRACLALARRLGLPAVTADRSWQNIADAVGVTVERVR